MPTGPDGPADRWTALGNIGPKGVTSVPVLATRELIWLHPRDVLPGEALTFVPNRTSDGHFA